MSKYRTVHGQLAAADGGWQNADGRYDQAGLVDYADELPAHLPLLLDHRDDCVVGEIVAVERARSGALYATAVLEDPTVDVTELRRYMSPGVDARRVNGDACRWTDARLEEVSLVEATAGVVGPISWHGGDVRCGSLGVRAFTGDPERARLARARQEYDDRWRGHPRHILDPWVDALVAAGDADREHHERAVAAREARLGRQHREYRAAVADALAKLPPDTGRYPQRHPLAVTDAWR